MKQCLDDLLDELDRNKAAYGTRRDFLNWLFEYGCQKAEWEGINPSKAPGYVVRSMRYKANQILIVVKHLYKNRSDIYPYILNYEMLDIQTIVSREHGGGVPLIE